MSTRIPSSSTDRQTARAQAADLAGWGGSQSAPPAPTLRVIARDRSMNAFMVRVVPEDEALGLAQLWVAAFPGLHVELVRP